MNRLLLQCCLGLLLTTALLQSAFAVDVRDVRLWAGPESTRVVVDLSGRAQHSLLVQYDRFLETTNAEEKELIRRFMDKETSRTYMNAAYTFGDLVFEALTHIGNSNRFHRLLIV